MFLSTFGGPGQGDGQLAGPTGIAVDPNGRCFVADHVNNRIDQFDRFGTLVRAWGTIGSGPGEFNVPIDVAASAAGGIYVVDLANNRIQVFRDMPVAVANATWGQVKSRYR